MASFCARNKYKTQKVIRNEINLRENSLNYYRNYNMEFSYIYKTRAMQKIVPRDKLN